MSFTLKSKPPTAVKLATRRNAAKVSHTSYSGTGNAGAEFRPPIVKYAIGPIIQKKLSVSEPNDKYEQEADRVADQVVRMPEPTSRQPVPRGSYSGVQIQRQCLACQNEERIQTKAIADSVGGSDNNSMGLRNTQGSGIALPDHIRSFFEPRFGHDFRQVRIHSDQSAADSARSVRARAYTLGNRVVFGAGEYRPGTTEGRRLLAHELTHVIQQRGNLTSQMQCQALPQPLSQIERNLRENVEENCGPLSSSGRTLERLRRGSTLDQIIEIEMLFDRYEEERESSQRGLEAYLERIRRGEIEGDADQFRYLEFLFQDMLHKLHVLPILPNTTLRNWRAVARCRLSVLNLEHFQEANGLPRPRRLLRRR